MTASVHSGSSYGASISTRGRFFVEGAGGADLTPSRRKDRGLIALLAMAPQRRRSRAWLQGLLWSDRAPDQAAGSLRRTLCDLRRTLGEASCILASDRFEVWLTDAARIDQCDKLAGLAELLEAIEVPDPAFEDWLRDLRATDRATGETQASHPSQARPGASGAGFARSPIEGGPRRSDVVVICRSRGGHDRDADFFADCLIGALSERMEAEGAVAIQFDDETAPDRAVPQDTLLRIELSSLVEHGHWNAHMRALADRNRRFLWSGRLRLPLDARRITSGSELPAFVSTSLSQILARYRASRPADPPPYLTMPRAAVRLFDGDRASLEAAERQLAGLPNGDWTPIALAWRAFARLTRVIEFGETHPDVVGEALELAETALRARSDNPLVAALAARVMLKLAGDVDRAHHLAQAAVRTGDQNPYSFNAAAQVHLIRGEWQAAYAAARRGRLMAEGLPHAHCWDMQVSLTALGIGDLTLSLKAARLVHARAPSYRPALRYLTAVSLLTGDAEGAKRHAGNLRLREPSFDLAHLARPDYPVQTLRATGYASALPAAG